jgi:hypothetical protein
VRPPLVVWNCCKSNIQQEKKAFKYQAMSFPLILGWGITRENHLAYIMGLLLLEFAVEAPIRKKKKEKV